MRLHITMHRAIATRILYRFRGVSFRTQVLFSTSVEINGEIVSVTSRSTSTDVRSVVTSPLFSQWKAKVSKDFVVTLPSSFWLFSRELDLQCRDSVGGYVRKSNWVH